MLRKMFFLIFLSLLISPVVAQDRVTHLTPDGAVEFSYSEEWTLTFQDIVYNSNYRFTLFDVGDLMISINLINPETDSYWQTFETARGYAEYMIDGYYLESEFDFTETEITGYPAVRSNPIVDYRRVFTDYVILRNDGWIVVASVTNHTDSQESNLESGEGELLSILETLQFDAEAAEAAIPIERNLEPYNTDNIILGKSYTSDSGFFSLQYPADWEILDTKENIIENLVNFALPDENIELSLHLMNCCRMRPYDEDSPEEYLQALRNTENGEVSEFRIGEHDAVSVITTDGEQTQQIIAYAITEQDIVQGTITISSSNLLTQYESQLVAVMESVYFIGGSTTINSTILNIALPEPWKVDSAYNNLDNTYTSFSLVSSDETLSQSARIEIILLNLEEMDLSEAADEVLEELVVLLSAESDIELEAEFITISQYEVLRSEITTTYNGGGNEIEAVFSLILLDDNWLFYSIAHSRNHEDIPAILQVLDTIIADMEITLPEN